jgi:ferrochelatase
MTRGDRRTGVLLVNLGSPAAPSVPEVRRFLREFLSDPRVIDIPGPARWLLLNGAILPFRPRTSAAAYRSIWTEAGSPLLLHSRALTEEVAKRLGPRYVVVLGMRYGSPSIRQGMEALADSDVERTVVVPLFPQYAASSTGSALEEVYRVAGSSWNVPAIQSVGAFYDEAGFLSALADVAGPHLERFRPDHVLMSYHGLPERQVRRSDSTGRHCLESDRCCEGIGPSNRNCYRAQCFATSRGLASALGLPEDGFTVSFQSRLGRTPWIRPYTDHVLPELAARGVRRVAVICASFVADCLETLEEIGIRGRAQWQSQGGEELLLVPCLNAHPRWVQALADLVRSQAGESSA